MNIDAFRWNLSMLGGCILRGCSGSWNPLTWRCQVGVLDGLEVAGGALDTEPEQVTDAADVAAGGVDPAEDAVLAQCLRAQGGVQPREAVADRDESGCGASVDEQVRVGRVGPGTGSVAEPCGQAGADGGGHRDGSAVDDEAAVDDVGELQPTDLFDGQCGEPLSSCTSIMRRPYRQTVTHADHLSTVGLRLANRRPPADTPLSLARRRNEPESIEIAVCRAKA